MVNAADTTCTVPPWTVHRLRVPRTDRSVLAVPSLDAAMPAASDSLERLAHANLNIQGRPLSVLRRWSRQACLDAAQRYTGELEGTSAAPPRVDDEVIARPLFVAGHQPSLFHPGVWVKNFAIDALARQAGGVSLNLVVDNDTLSTTSIRVPVGTRERPAIKHIPFDARRPVAPWEDALVQDGELFDSFAERVANALHGWGIEPLLQDIWPDAVSHRHMSPRLCDCLTAARHRQERRWGVSNLELPISWLCQTEPFLWFASHLLAQLPRLHQVHNEVLAEYRCLNHVRSRNHPVPELGRIDDWLEAPLWVWTRGETHRRRVFARQTGREVLLSNGHEVFANLPLTAEGEACCAVEVLRELPARDIHLRTRALTTTLFSRLCLGDLFVHGIGGAKYDEMTDQIMARFFGLAPPPFVAMSATLHLPMAKPWDVTPEDERTLLGRLRDLEFNADKALDDPRARPLIERKHSLISAQETSRTNGLTLRERRQRRPQNEQRFRELRQVNEQLASLASPQHELVTAELESVREMLTANQVLQGREYSFALYPPEMLREFLGEAVRLDS